MRGKFTNSIGKRRTPLTNFYEIIDKVLPHEASSVNEAYLLRSDCVLSQFYLSNIYNRGAKYEPYLSINSIHTAALAMKGRSGHL